MKQLLRQTFILAVIFLVSLGCDKKITGSDLEIPLNNNVSNGLDPRGTIDGVKVYKSSLTQLYPQNGDVLDNGCRNQTDPIIWNFSWTNVKGATEYRLHVYHTGSRYPLINNRYMETNSYEFKCDPCYIGNSNRFDWNWRVRALVNGVWTDWTPEIVFDVEPLNSDC